MFSFVLAARFKHTFATLAKSRYFWPRSSARNFCHVLGPGQKRGSRRINNNLNFLSTTTTSPQARAIVASSTASRAAYTMSSSEGEDFEFNDDDNASESEGYAPAPVEKKVCNIGHHLDIY